ncbi:MAG: N-acetyltransferase, partial [Candidatus Eremiobacteraeota bacterium]|nr:N-acetyltransferase [Candidatus Eremiobacteraeota bacterium]
RSRDVNEKILATTVRAGATIGGNATIGPGVEIGRFALVGMGSVVTRSIPDFHLAIGAPARSVGCVCRCGLPLIWFSHDVEHSNEVTCIACSRAYGLRGRDVSEK